MFKIEQTHIPAPNGVTSLCWDGETLVDWVSGGYRYYLNGHVEPNQVLYGFIFDAAVISPTGEYAAIYVKQGTKALILNRGRIIRELNRSFSEADAYEYPIALFQLKNGQDVVAHCPDHYNQLEIDDLATGKRLTISDTRSPSDFYFSRLAATPDGKFLLSAGWIWHPVDCVKVFRVEDALNDPSHLDGEGLDMNIWSENNCACFIENGRLIVALEGEEDDEGNTRSVRNPFGVFRVFDLDQNKLQLESYPQAQVGTMMPVGENHVIGFYEYPKLFDLQTGAVIQSWPHLKSGKQKSSIVWGIDTVPPIAFDSKNLRFAIADEKNITVIQLLPQEPQ